MAQRNERSEAGEFRGPRAGGIPTWAVWLGVLTVALGLRVVCLSNNRIIAADASRFLAAAERFEEGDYAAALRDNYHPLTAWLISQANLALPGPADAEESPISQRSQRERAAHAVELFFGVALVLIWMDLTRRLFPSVPPWAVGLLVASQPYLIRSAAEIRSDTVFLAWFSLALWGAAAAATGRRVVPALALSGVATGLAYLTRPEGLVLLPAVGVYWLWHSRFRLRATALPLAVFAGLCSVVMAPYVVAISELAGRPTLTLKKDVFGMAQAWVSPQSPGDRADWGSVAIRSNGSNSSDSPTATVRAEAGATVRRPAAKLAALRDPPPDPPPAQLLGATSLARTLPPEPRLLSGGAGGWLLVRWITTTGHVLAALSVLGLILALRRTECRSGLVLVGLAAGGMLCVLLLLISLVGDPAYVVRRHVYSLVLLSLPLSAIGLAGIATWLAKRVSWGGFLDSPVRWTAVLALLVATPLAVRGILPRRQGQLAQLEAARFIREHYGAGEVVYTDREKVAYYADAAWLPLTEPGRSTLSRARRWERSWVSFYRESVRCCPTLAREIERPDWGFEKVAVFAEQERNFELLLYRWQSPTVAERGPASTGSLP